VIETTKANGLSPYYYPKYLFETLPNIELDNQDTFDQSLPWSKDLPKECYLNTN